MNSIAFKSNICFINKQTFRKIPIEELKSEGKYIGFPWVIDDIFTKDSGYTDDIFICSAGGITDKEKITFFHLVPISDNLKNGEVALTSESGIMRNRNKERTGFIIGGQYDHEKDMDYSNSKKSRPLFEKLKEFFKKNKIPHSIIWGQDSRKIMHSHIFYSAKAISGLCEKDSWLINTTHPINDLEDLKNTFKFIHISNKDKLFINGKEIPGSKANAPLPLKKPNK